MIEKITKKLKRKLPIIIGVTVIIAAAVVCSIFLKPDTAIMSSTEITNWGLSFQNEGQCPIGNAEASFLKEYDAYFVGDTNAKTIYLTFDAGYEAGYTSGILDVLKAQNVQATFFLVGNYLETAPDLVKRMADEGHLVGNHTYTHPDMSTVLDETAFKNELTKVENLYKELTGKEITKLYRPPQGKYCTDNLKMAQEMGYNTIFWSLAYVDWYKDDQPTKEQAFSKLIPRIHDGAILLLHSTSKTNGEILDELITKYKELGYEFGNLMELTNN